MHQYQNTHQLLSSSRQKQDSREQFNSRIGYILVALGFSVGYGSFWRFPYLVYKHGGGAFLIPYSVMMVTVGIPLLYLQTAVGQMHQNTLPKIYQKINKGFKMLGYVATFVALNIAIYYNSLLTYSYRYIFVSFISPLPISFQAQNDYFNTSILNKSSSINQFGTIQWDLAILFLMSLWICYQFIKRGINVGTRILFFTVSSPYVLLLILIWRGLYLPGALDGLSYLFKPDFSKLFTGTIWKDAAIQVFYQLSVASAGIVHFASLKKKKQQFQDIIYIMPIGLVLCGLLSGIAIFIYVGHYSSVLNVSINDLPLSGPQLTFSIIPKAISLLPWSNAWLLLFSFILVLLGIDTEFGTIESSTGPLEVEVKQNGGQVCGKRLTDRDVQFWTIVFLCLFFPLFCSSAGIYYTEFFDTCTSCIPVPFVAIMQIYFFVYLFELDKLQAEIIKSTGRGIPSFIKVILKSKYLIVVLLGILFFGIYDQINSLESWGTQKFIFGWILSLYPIIIGIAYFLKNKESQYNLQFPRNDIIQLY